MRYMSWLSISAICAVLAVVGFVYAEPTPTFQYTVMWSANTEADMAGYILESSTTEQGPWIIVNDNIPFGTNTWSVIYSTNVRWFRVSAFDKSKNISGPSTPMQGAYQLDNIKPSSPNIMSVNVVPVEEIVVVPNVTSPKLTVSGKAMTVSWDAKNAETQIYMSNSMQAEMLLTTVGPNGTNTTINGTVSGWHCFKMRHKIGGSLGEWAIANPADPSDINFCTSIP